jgi:hypothetical protein
MTFVRRLGLGVLCVMVAAGAADLIAPRAVHAVVSTLVTVANTPANPVYVDEAGPQQPFQQRCESIGSAGSFSNSCTIAVPSGKLLVVKTVSLMVGTDPGVTVGFGEVAASLGGGNEVFRLNVPSGGRDAFGFGQNQVTQKLDAYSDSDLPFNCGVVLSGPTQVNDFTCTVSGYLVNPR